MPNLNAQWSCTLWCHSLLGSPIECLFHICANVLVREVASPALCCLTPSASQSSALRTSLTRSSMKKRRSPMRRRIAHSAACSAAQLFSARHSFEQSATRPHFAHHETPSPDLGRLKKWENSYRALGSLLRLDPPLHEHFEAALADPAAVLGGDDVDDRPRGGRDGVAGAETEQVFSHLSSVNDESEDCGNLAQIQNC